MTVIVDTCSLQAENSPVIFETPKLRSLSPPVSPAFTIRESEDSCYDSASTFIAPRGVIGQAVPMMPPPHPMTTAGMFNVHNRKPSMGRLKNWAQKNEEEKRNTSVSMFTGMNSKQPNAQISKPLQKEKEEQFTLRKSVERKEQEHGAGTLGDKQKSKHFKSTISRFARALLRVLSAGTIQSSSKEGKKDSEKPKRGKSEKPRRTITMEAIENNPGKPQSNFRIHRLPSESRGVSISRRRGIPSLPPVVPPAIPSTQTHHEVSKVSMIPSELAFINAEPRRSKSLSYLRPTKAASSTTPSPAGSIKRRPRSRSFTSINNKLSVISPPIPPRRSSLELGTNAQYKCLSMDKAAIQEVFNDMDGATLGSGTRSRSGTGDTASTSVSLSPTLVSIDVSHTFHKAIQYDFTKFRCSTSRNHFLDFLSNFPRFQPHRLLDLR